MNAAEEKSNVIKLAEHRWLENTPTEVTDFQKQFAGEVLDVVELCNDPRFDWVPFASAIKAIMAGKMDPSKMSDEIAKLRDARNREEPENKKYDKAA